MLRLTIYLSFALFATFPPACLSQDDARQRSAPEEDPFQSGVRPTDPLTPEQEQQSFQLPPGFTIQLVAAEPDILKPLNMAFDARGRLWVTMTQEYPYAAPPDREPRDALKILEDTNGDGRADKITTFADKLNIPIGVYPYGRGAIVFSIPHIWYLEDTDGDDVCDRRTRLFGPMGFERDTHGLNNAFRRGFDGWLYACHGFNNETRVAGTDGHEIHMVSGNAYRMRVDGTRVEHFTWGQVNPFGMAIDPLFNIFTADCHSKPISDLMRDGYYQSFGRPHDGLGFVPDMMDHLHGSTAICGIVHYSADRFPAEFRNNLFSGNVMTSRINRNALEFHGATMRCIEKDDFLKTSDPWFRPVDLQIGPDGALYVADFYNRIIGHYEVPLTHPGRDRTSGRIWRIVYEGNSGTSRSEPFDLTRADVNTLIAELASKNITRRMLAADQLADRVGPAAVRPLLEAAEKSDEPLVRLHALWVLFRLNSVDDQLLERAASDSDSAVRVHAMKVISELNLLSERAASLARQGLSDSDPFVRRAAADALGQQVEHDAVEELLKCLFEVPEEDVMLRHAVRIALRNQLRVEDRMPTMADIGDSSVAVEIASVVLGIESPAAGDFLVDYLSTMRVAPQQTMEYLRHAATWASPASTSNLIGLVREQFAENVDVQVALLGAVTRGFQQRGARTTPELKQWAQALTDTLLAAAGNDAGGWVTRPVRGAGRGPSPWVLEERRSADGTSAAMLSSLPAGEQLTGALRSPHFEAPAKFSFYLAGHSGTPDKPVTPLNHVRLCDAETGDVLIREPAPRNDVAQLIEWDLTAHSGKQVYLEFVDGDNAGGFAWLAAGRFEPAVISLPAVAPSTAAQRLASAAEMISQFELTECLPELQTILQRDDLDPQAAAAVARATIRFQPDARYDALAVAIADPETPRHLEADARRVVADRNDAAVGELLMQIMQNVPARQQQAVASALAADLPGAEMLLEIVQSGRASPRLLQSAEVAQRLNALNDAALLERVEEIVAQLPPARDDIDRMIAQRRREFNAAPRSLEAGAAVLEKSCVSCHQLAGKGAMIGPQLDGIGNRGLERILEDLLDPHRNVDVAFRTTTLVLTSGKIVTGLVRREEGATLVLVDDQGKEFTVPMDEIDEQYRTTLSLMPENVATSLMPEEFYNLVAFLLEQRGESGAE